MLNTVHRQILDTLKRRDIETPGRKVLLQLPRQLRVLRVLAVEGDAV